MTDTIAKFLQEGGSFMWVLGIIGIFAVAVIIERLYFYFVVCKENSSDVTSEVLKSINKGDIKTAEGRVARLSSPLGNVINEVIQKAKHSDSYDDVQKGLEEVSIKEVPRLTQRINSLSLFANVSTLAGLLGTIFGLQVSFSSLALAEGAEKATALANGISQAMNTTAMGLIVAIPCMIAFSYLNGKQEKLTEELDEATVKIMNALEKRMA